MKKSADELLIARLEDRIRQAADNYMMTAGDFLDMHQRKIAEDYCKGRKLPVRYVFYGGYEDAERCMPVFLPDYMDASETGQQVTDELMDLVRVIRVTAPKGGRSLTHRDYLGAIMNLGMEREVIGDIICSAEYAAVSVLAGIAGVIEKELVRVRHTTVICERINFNECGISPQFREIRINIASERTDAILGEVYHLSRAGSQELIRTGMVSVNGREVTDPGHTLKDKDRVSVRSKGKFIYAGREGTTKKGRITALVTIYI